MNRFKGLSISGGKVHGAVCLYSAHKHADTTVRLIAETEIAFEIERLDNAVDECAKELEQFTADVRERVGAAESEIFSAQRHILLDKTILATIRAHITTELTNAESAVARIFGQFEERFLAMSDMLLRERSTDIGEVRHRLISSLAGTRAGFNCAGLHKCSRGRDRIIVAEELTADMMVHMDSSRVRGIVTEKGGVGSHAAMIARSLGIPAVSGLRGVYSAVSCGSSLLVDGDTGEVFIDPDERFIVERIPDPDSFSDAACHLESPAGISVMANASSIEDVRNASTIRADGIGLFRTEILFLRAERLLGEDEQSDYYRQVMVAAHGRPVTFRLMDIGGDKELPFLRIEKEENPFLGFRGARFLLGNPDILETQVRALVRLCDQWTIRIMFPMIIDAPQHRKLVALVRGIVDKMGIDQSKIKVGAMIETPSAFMQIDEIAAESDFLSIGSNDLTQYMFAVDRSNALVSGDYNPDHPVLWSALSGIAKAAAAKNIPVSICGEMAGMPGMPQRLIDIGIKILSVSSKLVSRVRGELIVTA